MVRQQGRPRGGHGREGMDASRAAREEGSPRGAKALSLDKRSPAGLRRAVARPRWRRGAALNGGFLDQAGGF
jgi:hypothetical protein